MDEIMKYPIIQYAKQELLTDTDFKHEYEMVFKEQFGDIPDPELVTFSVHEDSNNLSLVNQNTKLDKQLGQLEALDSNRSSQLDNNSYNSQSFQNSLKKSSKTQQRSALIKQELTMEVFDAVGEEIGDSNDNHVPVLDGDDQLKQGIKKLQDRYGFDLYNQAYGMLLQNSHLLENEEGQAELSGMLSSLKIDNQTEFLEVCSQKVALDKIRY